MDTKVCSTCNEEKHLDAFSKRKDSMDGHYHYCKSCRNEKDKKYREENKESIKEKKKKYYEENKELIKENQKKYYEENKESIKENQKKYNEENIDKVKEQRRKKREENKESIKEKKKKYYEENKENLNEKKNKRHKERYQSDPLYKLSCLLRSRMLNAIKEGRGFKFGKSQDLLGCSFEEARLHIESLFTEGMTWENQGEWHIDHIKPCALFDLTNEDEQRECFHYSNLQPLWASDNLSKSNKYDWKMEDFFE